jgi:2-dehydro-3-deoxyphosphogalactonate aldolase
MSAVERFNSYLSECPLIAIIRGVKPDEAEAIGAAIFASGIRIIEVPLNSPEPFESIRALASAFGDRALIGAGTVLDPADVPRVAQVGGQIIVSPNVQSAVIEASVAAGMVAAPGFFTPSEAFEALRAGAHCLKLFPAEAASPAVVKAQRAVLPKNLPLIVVGGVRPDNMRPYLEAGATGFGLGSGVYVPGRSPQEVEERARAYMESVNV